ncbi:hypothetical protein [Thermostichus sp. MS-CIW-28]
MSWSVEVLFWPAISFAKSLFQASLGRLARIPRPVAQALRAAEALTPSPSPRGVAPLPAPFPERKLGIQVMGGLTATWADSAFLRERLLASLAAQAVG